MTIKPQRADGSGAMFDGIARRYDLLNRLMSLGLDRQWRRALVAALKLPERGGDVLDIATGTADVALRIANILQEGHVIGLDPSTAMLAGAKKKAARKQSRSPISFVRGDALSLPFPDEKFTATCISFGIRNVPDRIQALREMRRVTKHGGVVAVLELSEPRAKGLSLAARWHVHRVVPLLGGLLSGAAEYHYLKRSIAQFLRPEQFIALMQEVELREVKAQSMTFGAVHLFSARV